MLRTGTIFESGLQGTVIVVYRENILTNGGTVFSSASESQNRRIAFIGSYFAVGTNYRISFSQSNLDTADTPYGDTVLQTNFEYIGSWRSNSSNYSLRLTSDEQALTFASGADTGDWFGDVSTRDNFVVGAVKSTTEFSFFIGDIAEIRVYCPYISSFYFISVKNFHFY